MTVFVVWSSRDVIEGVFPSLADAVQHSSNLDRIGEFEVGQKGSVLNAGRKFPQNSKLVNRQEYWPAGRT